MAEILLLPVSAKSVCHVEILLSVSIFTFASSPACHSVSACEISSKSDDQRQSYHVISIFSKWRPRYRNSTSGFVFRDYAHLGRSKTTCRPNFDDISQSTAEMLLLPVSKNKRPPCWNSGLNFHLCIIIGMWFCICLPNFVEIGPSAVKLWRQRDFQDSRHQPYWIFSRVTADHPRSASDGFRLVLKFRRDRIKSFRDIAIFNMLWSFGLKFLFTWLYQNKRLIYVWSKN